MGGKDHEISPMHNYNEWLSDCKIYAPYTSINRMVKHTQSLPHQHVWAQHQRVKGRCRYDEFVCIFLPHDSLPCFLIIVIIMVVGRRKWWVGWRCRHRASMTQSCRRKKSLYPVVLCLPYYILAAAANTTALCNVYILSYIPLFYSQQDSSMWYLMKIILFGIFHAACISLFWLTITKLQSLKLMYPALEFKIKRERK